jgi:hypothetical protein
MPRPTARPDPKRRPADADHAEVQNLKRLFHQEAPTPTNRFAIAEILMRLSQDKRIAAAAGGWKERIAAAVGVSTSTLDKCLHFRRLYEEKDLAELERMEVGWYRLTIALAVTERGKRHRLLLRAKKEGWDEHTLQRAIQHMRGTRRGGGRPSKEEKGLGLQPDLSRLIGLTRTWSQFCTNVWSPGKQGYQAELESGLAGPARATLDGLLQDAAEKLKAMRKGCGDALAQVNALRKALRQHAAG